MATANKSENPDQIGFVLTLNYSSCLCLEEYSIKLKAQLKERVKRTFLLSIASPFLFGSETINSEKFSMHAHNVCIHWEACHPMLILLLLMTLK